MDIQEKQPLKTAAGRFFPILLCVGLAFVVVILILVCVITSKVTEISNNKEASQSSLAIKSLSLRERFPGYFRSPIEHAYFELKLYNFTKVDESPYSTGDQCEVSCKRNSSFIPIRPAFDVIHACCNSTPSYVSPDWKIDYNGKNRTLSTFIDNGIFYRQFFLTERCNQMNGCTYCSCQQQQVYYTGVYDDGEDHAVAFFEFNGCCKCLNLPNPPP